MLSWTGRLRSAACPFDVETGTSLGDFPPMQLLFIGLVVLFVYIFIRLLVILSAWMRGARYRAYRHLATRYGGRYESRGLSESPTVSFTHNGATVRVGLAPTVPGQPGQIPRTRVVVRFRSGIPFRLELAPVIRPAPPQSPKGTRLVKLGDPEFDRGFVVQANDLEMTRDFLCPAVRGTITNLHRAVHPGGMLVSINPERMLVQIDRNLGVNAESLSWAVHGSLTLHDALIEGVSRRMNQGIAIVDDPDAWKEDTGPPICKVCGEPISGCEVIVCAVCSTPHHRDCWEYVGACSIYGCNGKVGVRE
ncbi:MAG: RING finger protein [Isosphaerales bacterium]